MFIASDLLDILVPGLAGLFVQSVAIAVLPVAALAPQAQVAQVLHHDILQPCPARAPRRVPRLTRGRLARLQLIQFAPDKADRLLSQVMLGQSGGNGRAAATSCGPTHSTRYSSSTSVSEPARSTNQQAVLSVSEYPRLLLSFPFS